MEPFIIPSVEFNTGDIPEKPFFRGTKKISIKVSDEGIVYTGKTIKWTEIRNVFVKFFNSNPYIQLEVNSGEILSFFFENKFYYRRKSPWFGASEFITKEFVKTLEEKNIFTIAKLDAEVSDFKSTSFVHYLWNNFTFIFPVFLLLLSTVILIIGFFGGERQIHINTLLALIFFKK